MFKVGDKVLVVNSFSGSRVRGQIGIIRLLNYHTFGSQEALFQQHIVQFPSLAGMCGDVRELVGDPHYIPRSYFLFSESDLLNIDTTYLELKDA